ncbi:MAG: DUF4340 domain-containing protein [Acetobacteraceae bacterium]
MKRSSVILFGLAALVAAAAAAVVVLRGEPPRTEANLLDRPVFPDLAARLGSVATIELRRHDGTVTLTRRGEGWVIAEKHGFPARPERVRELLVGLAELRLVEARTGNPELFARLGLEDVTEPGGSSVLVTLSDAARAPMAELIVGRRRIRTSGTLPESVHVRRPGESQTWLAEGTVRVDTDPMLWLDRDILDLRRERVARVTTRRAGFAPLTVSRRDPAAAAEVIDPAEGVSADPIRVDDLPRALEFLSFADVRPAADLAAADPAGEARIETFDGIAVSVRLVAAEDGRWALFDVAWSAPETSLPADAPETLPRPEAARAEAERLAARLGPWAFRLPDWKADVLTYRPEDVARRDENPA